MKPFRLPFATFLFAIAIVSLTGCYHTRVVGGTPIRAEAINMLQTGTPYQEVVAELGQPTLLLDGKRVIAYRWDTNRGYTDVYRDALGSSQEIYTKEMNPLYYALCLKFDDQKKLQAWTRMKTSTSRALQQQMKQWTTNSVER